ncbi:glycine zipper domain-containing protein [Kiloniella laminariae]|uniref:Glycine zipper domain-containing protein n=1 Tax=Kiloniella laminariae TaxID=454162 RepID=A0ABT4LEN3_9PROT|nr:glycine zipper domain-containing protein [Kiloniella laminariae]MCZ4279547.1 glycine zipper domain-containing protein [Kiloniella laminariae]
MKKNMRITAKLITGVLLSVSLLVTSGCANKQQTGTVIGAVVGVAVGSLVGKGDGQGVGMLVGGAIGALVGNSVGQTLDELDEAEKAKAERASLDALEQDDGEKIEWNSDDDEDISGSAELIGGGYEKQGESCRPVRELVVIDGVSSSKVVEYCLKGNSWVAS